MVLGFNHNIMYKGEIFHVQTEDSGRANPHIITLLYRGGTIIASAKTSYADIIKVDQLEAVVESIMKEQHKQMMRRLKDGEFDSRIFPNNAAAPQPVDAPTADAIPAPPVPPAAAVQQPIHSKPISPAAGGCPNPAPSPSPSAPPENPVKRSLDEVILDYLITGEDK
jgi:hypothetical protein